MEHLKTFSPGIQLYFIITTIYRNLVFQIKISQRKILYFKESQHNQLEK